MIGFLVVSHGDLAQGLRTAIEMIVGEKPDIKYAIFPPDESPDDFKEKVETELATLDLKSGVVIFSDLLGGTPFNICAKIALENERIELISGFNLGMVIEAITVREEMEFQELIRVVVESGKSNIKALSGVL